MKHANIALFIPHNGCSHQCSYCNQKSITGKTSQPGPKEVEAALACALQTQMGGALHSELAFFGGSFTAIDEAYMCALLQAAYPYVKSGKIDGIRISTRPDAIDAQKLGLLKRYGVTSIELGAQSMDDDVLSRNQRGHTAQDVKNACEQIRRWGFSLGLQMMTGLFGSSPKTDWASAQKLLQCKPDTMRIYPTVVLKNTALEKQYRSGEYRPMGVQEAVLLCAALLDLFEENGISVIKVGLQDSPELKRDVVAGAFHPAFRELCEAERYFIRVLKQIKEKNLSPQKLLVRVGAREISKAVGQKRRNVIKLKDMGYHVRFVGDETLTGLQIEVEKCG